MKTFSRKRHCLDCDKSKNGIFDSPAELQILQKSTPFHSQFIFAVVTILSLALGEGCTTPSQGKVARDWSLAMRELNIIPVFPPREDVEVGDIYISPLAPEEEESITSEKSWSSLGLWVASIDLSKEIKTFYSHRNAFPKTPEESMVYMKNQTNNPFMLVPQAADRDRNVFEGGDCSRLRMVGFPAFLSATLTQSDLLSVIPVEALSIAIGAHYSSSKKATISVPVAESYGIPASEVYRRLIDPVSGKLTGSIGKFRASDILAYSAASQPSKHDSNQKARNYCFLRVITEVFYARALDVSVQWQRSAGAGATIRPVISSQTINNLSASTNRESIGKNTNGFIGVSESTSNPTEQATNLNRQLKEAMGQTSPGGSVKYLSVGDYGVSMRRTYERPIAIGYRGLLLLVHKDGRVKGMGAISSSISSNLPTANKTKK